MKEVKKNTEAIEKEIDWKKEENELRRMIYGNGEEIFIEEGTPHEVVAEMLKIHRLLYGTLTTPIYPAATANA